TNHYYLSQYFSQQGLTYNAYINGLRIRHFIRLCEKAVAENRAITAQQLAFKSGYRSYSTFSAAFKQHTGKSVSAWMRDAGA
ncbi:MAG: AraC family transcriptional regulator, partial [Bacteroidales bacterium]|nr:AraC family transcriptional regulator [Bacteroidales bacterium]